ncbi:hypothetical protein [Burkholderia sp. Bp9031]|uniref:hypothetical protein n=1 Tax=Burkholderia sp. Bp9031 TaxID=2184566 RepID=UPI000F5F21FD|nr:hypothetical protein [Burkholderia sp. Bp9031]
MNPTTTVSKRLRRVIFHMIVLVFMAVSIAAFVEALVFETAHLNSAIVTATISAAVTLVANWLMSIIFPRWMSWGEPPEQGSGEKEGGGAPGSYHTAQRDQKNGEES